MYFQVAPQTSIVVHGQQPLTASMLAAASPEEQKQMLGECIFPLIQSVHGDMAGKITGMLLEMDNSELLIMLENSDLLEEKVRKFEDITEGRVMPFLASDY